MSIEKRLVAFLVGSLLIMVGYVYLMQWLGLAPKPEPAQPPAEVAQQDDDQPDGEPPQVEPVQPLAEQPPEQSDQPPPAQPPELPPAGRPVPQQRRLVVGSVDPESPYRMAVTFNSRGAVVERIELSDARYRDVNDRSGYLGNLAVDDTATGGGCRVNVVVPGTPAAKAGLRIGDVIEAVDDQAVESAEHFARLLGGDRPGEPYSRGGVKPGQTIALTVARPDGEKTIGMKLKAELTRRPLEVVRPEGGTANGQMDHDPLSLLTTFEKIGTANVVKGDSEIVKLLSLHGSNWEVVAEETGPEQVAFRFVLTPTDLEKIGQQGALEIIKRYRLVAGEQPVGEAPNEKAYHLQFELELHNRGDAPQTVAYRLDGPTGLPLEGWWYSYKTHPTKFGSAGARDVVFRRNDSTHELATLPKIVGYIRDEEDEAGKLLFDKAKSKHVALDYIGVDTQYFAAVLLPENGDEADVLPQYAGIFGRAAGPIPEEAKLRRKTNVSFRLVSADAQLEPGVPIKHRFTIFAGPKQPEVLAHYGLGECISYGWFGSISKPLVGLLHFFYKGVRNYGLAIILLTILVRGCMYPLGRKQAKNALKMQELAPEMKKIADKYKTDMEKRSKAQRELFQKHNYNPLSGCWLMFLQLPIFIGLYRGLSVDIELRAAPLIPGASWCSNLAGPDMLFYWGDSVWAMLASPTGWLGPFFNLLPLFSVGLFLMHQKLFTPPATDEQQKMQQNVMKFMTLFIGVMFFKVAAGLCIYFISSSLWGLAERLLLPKTKPAEGAQEQDAKKPEPRTPSRTKSEAAVKRARRGRKNK